MEIRILRGYAVTMLSRTFNFAIRGFHYLRTYWSPEKQKSLPASTKKTTPSTYLLLKHAKKMVMIVGHLPRELSRTLKFILGRGARTGFFHIESLQKITVGSRRDGNPLPSDSENVDDFKEWTTSWLFNRASRSCVLWTKATRHPWFFFGWWNWGWMCIKWDLQNKFTKSWKKTKETRSHDIRDMFRRQKETHS